MQDKTRIILFFWLLFLAGSATVPYGSLYYEELFRSASEPHTIEFITILLALFPLLSIFSNPVAGYLADRFQMENRVLFFCSVAVTLGAILLLIPSTGLLGEMTGTLTFGFLAAGIIITGLFSGPVFPIVNTETIQYVHHAHEPEGSYGKYRVHGSISWVVFSLVIGTIIHLTRSFQFVMVIYVAGYALIALSSRSGMSSRLKPVKVDLSLLTHDRGFFIFLIFCFLQSAGLFGSLYFTGYFLRDAKLDYLTIGLAFSLSALAEIPLMFAAKHLVRWLGNKNLITLGTLFLTLKLAGLVLASESGNPFLLIGAMMFNGLGFGLQVTGIINAVDLYAHPHLKATYFNIYTVLGANIPMALGLIFNGYLIRIFDSKMMMLVSGIITFTSIVFLLLFVKIPKSRPA
ncbi:MAG: MFS transporter [Spirochaetaceae bacterium]|nr:MAG: MFS transporter [Spirochaetaceae bacterium]